MGLKFNVDKYAIDNANDRIKATAAVRRTPLQYTGVVRRKVNNIKNKKLSLANRKFLRIIGAK